MTHGGLCWSLSRLRKRLSFDGSQRPEIDRDEILLPSPDIEID